MSHVDPRSSGAAFGGDASFSALPKRFSGKFSGFSYDAESCPDCGTNDQLKGAAGGGLIGWGVMLLFGGSSAGRILGLGIGAALGAVAAKWHLRVDWDPEALRGGARPSSTPPAAPERGPEAN